MPLYLSSIVFYMVRCNDIHLAKRLQYAALSLVGPSISSRIGSHIGRDKLVSEPTLAVTWMFADRCAVMLFMTFVTRRGTRHGTCAGLDAQTYVPRGNVPMAGRGRRFL